MDSDEVGKAKERKILRRTLLASAIGTACYLSAALTISGLQSSINLRESLGTTCLAIRLATAILGNLIVSPFVVKRKGPKCGLIVAELTDMVFTISNFYPNWYTMPIASAISGFGGSMIWVASGTILQSVARRSAQGRDVAVEKQRLGGIFFGIMAVGQIFSNGLAQVILKFSFSETKLAEDPIDSSDDESVTLTYGNSSNDHTTDMSSCASRDCPAEYAYLKSTSKFELFSPNQSAIYLLLSVFLFVQFAAVLIHSFLLPVVSPQVEDDFSGDKNANSSSRESLLPKKNSAWTDVVRGSRAVFTHFASFSGLLTFPIQLQFGLFLSFFQADFNRAFVSCVIGVEEVGACSLVSCSLNFLASISISRISPKLGIVAIMLSAMVFDIANFTISLLWVPSDTTLFLPYIFSSCYGISLGIRRNLTFLIASRYSRDSAIAFSAQSITVCCGEIISFAWSTPFCVYAKMYVLIAFLVFATACWGVVEYRMRSLTKSAI